MGKIAIITGATSGLGLCLSKLLLKDKYKVYGLSRTTSNWKVAKKFIDNIENYILKKLDVSNEESIKSFIEEIYNTENRIDILVNNVGYVHPLMRLEETDASIIQDSFNVNVMGTFYTCKYSIPIMLMSGTKTNNKEQPLIINISSMAGVRSVPLLGAYSACKKAVIGLSEAIAKENYGKIKCISVSPGGMNTPTRAQTYGKKDAGKQQSPDFVAEVIHNIINETIPVGSGSDVAVRYGKITAIHKSPDV